MSKAPEAWKRALAAGYPDYFYSVIATGIQGIRREPDLRALFKLAD